MAASHQTDTREDDDPTVERVMGEVQAGWDATARARHDRRVRKEAEDEFAFDLGDPLRGAEQVAAALRLGKIAQQTPRQHGAFLGALLNAIGGWVDSPSPAHSFANDLLLDGLPVEKYGLLLPDTELHCLDRVPLRATAPTRTVWVRAGKLQPDDPANTIYLPVEGVASVARRLRRLEIRGEVAWESLGQRAERHGRIAGAGRGADAEAVAAATAWKVMMRFAAAKPVLRAVA